MIPKATRWTTLAAVTLFGMGAAARGATHYAANNGVDGPACGTSASPCRTITQTITQAVPGDTIMVRPGRYGADLNRNGIVGETNEEVPALGGMIVIWKPLILLSTDGAAATILDARNVSTNTNVLIVTGDAEFGRPDHGFTVTNTANPNTASGIAPQGTNLKIRGNQVLNDNYEAIPLAVGIDAAQDFGYVILVEGNQVVGFGTGIDVWTGATASKNQVSLCTVGIAAAGARVAGNVAIGNSAGFSLVGEAVAIGNAAYGNSSGFSVRNPFTGVIQKNNIFGNLCGLTNTSVTGANATNNYWGASTGPGSDPADSTCTANGATNITTPFAASKFSINPSFEP